MKSAFVIGAGAWGTALSLVCERAGLKTTLWAHEKETVDEINTAHTNNIFLPHIQLPESLVATNNFSFIEETDLILLVPPAQHLERICKTISPFYKKKIPTLICSKGLEEKTGRLLSDIVKENIPNAILSILSGPTFAIETAENIPTAATLACEDKKVGPEIIQALALPSFRLYLSDDLIGAQVGGAVKNIIAIASGVIEGKELGRNTQAALLTRSVVEMMRLSTALGGKKETIMGLAD